MRTRTNHARLAERLEDTEARISDIQQAAEYVAALHIATKARVDWHFDLISLLGGRTFAPKQGGQTPKTQRSTAKNWNRKWRQHDEVSTNETRALHEFLTFSANDQHVEDSARQLAQRFGDEDSLDLLQSRELAVGRPTLARYVELLEERLGKSTD